MAALPYMQLYVADYLADTMHLDAEEHGAYLLLLMNYWQTGKPIPKSRLQKIARVPNDRWPTVEHALSEFFNDTGTDWVHDRVERDLADVREAQEQRVRAGKASAEARKRAKREEEKRESQREGNDRSTTVQREGNEVDTDTDTDKHHTSKSSIPPCPVEKIIEIYKTTANRLPGVRLVPDAVKGNIRARWRQDEKFQNLEFWQNLFSYCENHPFLSGQVDRPDKPPWRASLAWIVKQSNFAKIVNEEYER